MRVLRFKNSEQSKQAMRAKRHTSVPNIFIRSISGTPLNISSDELVELSELLSLEVEDFVELEPKVASLSLSLPCFLL